MGLGFHLHDTIILSRTGIGGSRRAPLRARPSTPSSSPRAGPEPSPHRGPAELDGRPAGEGQQAVRPDGERDVSCTATRTKPFGPRGNVCGSTPWGGRHTTRDEYALRASGPDAGGLARDLIVSWSRPGDVVLDPFGGAGTTAKMALLSHRRYLSMEAHRPYHDLAVRRIGRGSGDLPEATGRRASTSSPSMASWWTSRGMGVGAGLLTFSQVSASGRVAGLGR